METKEDFFTESKAVLQDYLDDRILLIKLQATDKAAKAAGSLVTAVLAIIFAIVLLTLLGILGGIFFTNLTGSAVTGFAIITGIYLVLILLVLVVSKKAIESSITNTVIRNLLGKETVKEKNLTDERHYN